MQLSLDKAIEYKIAEDIEDLESKYWVSIDDQWDIFYCQVKGELVSADDIDGLDSLIKDILYYRD